MYDLKRPSRYVVGTSDEGKHREEHYNMIRFRGLYCVECLLKVTTRLICHTEQNLGTANECMWLF